VGCGHFPRVLYSEDAQALRSLERLTVSSRAAAVLAAFDLNRDEPWKRWEARLAAIGKLDHLSGPVQEERWWRRYKGLFVQGTTAPPTRTR
jgi:hypothetical protein